MKKIILLALVLAFVFSISAYAENQLTIASAPSINPDTTSGIIDVYNKQAQDFDNAVNHMINDSQGVAGNRMDNTGSSSGNSSSTVNTAQLTTDALAVQSKQSLRDTIGGTASQVFKTLGKLAQKLDQ